MRVVLGLMGIGMVNAHTHATEAVVTHFPVAALVVSGVAGSTHRIADVVVADDWTDRDAGDVFVVNAALQSLAARAARGAPALAGLYDRPADVADRAALSAVRAGGGSRWPRRQRRPLRRQGTGVHRGRG